MKGLFQFKESRIEIFYLSLVLILTSDSLIHATNNDWRVFFLAVTGLVVFTSIMFFSISLGVFFEIYPEIEGQNPVHTLIALILILIFWASMPLIFKFINKIPLWRRVSYSYFCIMMFSYFLYSITAWIGNQGYHLNPN